MELIIERDTGIVQIQSKIDDDLSDELIDSIEYEIRNELFCVGFLSQERLIGCINRVLASIRFDNMIMKLSDHKRQELAMKAEYENNPIKQHATRFVADLFTKE